MVVIYVVPYCDLGNQMIQVINAQSIADRLGEATITGYDIPVWGLQAPEAPTINPKPFVVSNHLQDIDFAAVLVRKFGLKTLQIRSLRLRVDEFPDRQRIKALFN